MKYNNFKKSLINKRKQIKFNYTLNLNYKYCFRVKIKKLEKCKVNRSIRKNPLKLITQ